MISSAKNVPVEPAWAFFGEVGLGGEVRGVPQAEKRLHELARLGFTRAILPRASLDTVPRTLQVEAVGVSHIGALADLIIPGQPLRNGAQS